MKVSGINSLRKRNINWVKIPPYAPSQGGSWESMVKLIKNSLGRVLEGVRRKPSLIELQTFVSDAVRIVNDRPLTAVSSAPNDLSKKRQQIASDSIMKRVQPRSYASTSTLACSKCRLFVWS